jgi:hypothetical protein
MVAESSGFASGGMSSSARPSAFAKAMPDKTSRWRPARPMRSSEEVRISIPTRYADTIRTWRSTPILQHSTTPRSRNRERGRRRGRERSVMGLMRLMGRLISPIGPIRVCSRRLAPPKRDQFPLAANFACFLAGLACGEPEGCDCGLGVGLLFGLFMAIS